MSPSEQWASSRSVLTAFVLLPFIVVLVVEAAGKAPGSSKVYHSKQTKSRNLEPPPETAEFPWEEPTNENILDLSWSFDANTIYWNERDTFELNISTIGTKSTDFIQADHMCLTTTGGTHIDAPRSFHPKRWTVDQIPMRRLFNIPTVIIDVKKKVVKDRGYYLSVRDFQLWENSHGPLPNNSLILIRTGHHMLYGNREGYFGRTANGTRIFPSMGAKAARWLVKNRHVVGIGIDSPSVDNLTTHMGQRALAKKNAYVLENLGGHIDHAPKMGTYAFVMPMKIAGASGSPARVVLRVPHSRPKTTTPNPYIS